MGEELPQFSFAGKMSAVCKGGCATVAAIDRGWASLDPADGMIFVFFAWLIASLSVFVSYWAGGRAWRERFGVTMDLGRGARKMSGVWAEWALITYVALLVALVDKLTPAGSIMTISSNPLPHFAAVFLGTAVLVVIHETWEVVEARRTPQSYPEHARHLAFGYAPYTLFSTIMFCFCFLAAALIVDQFQAEQAKFLEHRVVLESAYDDLNFNDPKKDARSIMISVERINGLLSTTVYLITDQINSVLILLYCVLAINLLIEFTPMRSAYSPAAVVWTHAVVAATLILVVGIAAYIYSTAYLDLLQRALEKLSAVENRVVSDGWEGARRYYEVVTELRGKQGFTGFILTLTTGRGGVAFFRHGASGNLLVHQEGKCNADGWDYMNSATLLIGLLVVGYVGLVIASNRLARPVDRQLSVEGVSIPRQAQSRLIILNWNLGYAGLGKESEFIADGGNRILAPSAAIVEKNIAGIRRVLTDNSADVYTLQEASVASPLNYGRQLWQAVQQSLPGFNWIWLPDLQSRWLPGPIRLEHGLGTLSRVTVEEARTTALPLEPKFWFGLIRKQYAVLVSRMQIAERSASWVVINLHLAAFDERGNTRRRQLNTLLDLARVEHAKGNFVVLAGDWNMLLGGGEFPHSTHERFLEWVHPLPPTTLPPEWQLVYDPATPTVRTLHKPYVAGENFVGIIDGFLVSPNVEVEMVTALDLGFEYSDHNPVRAVFRARSKNE